jgi:hypothetical protein
MRNIAYDNLTETTVRAYAGAGDRRTGDILQLVIQRLHDFVREAGITPGEWEDAMGFLARAVAATVMGPFFVSGTPAPICPWAIRGSASSSTARCGTVPARRGPNRNLAERAILPPRRAGSGLAGA